ncbi:hypothetical protein TWF730_004976 [Orbilia blumenaviensis]|uniref:Major facilitator superfamily (MFS) profile domain-containing protein n=1 Tax=Orbilia blumenaviensis TaxID=1796055 RepID=A0AAV9VH64_9PEZI
MANLTYVERTEKKGEVECIESINGQKDVSNKGQRDHFGSALERGSAENALVRKLDWRIMPTLWVMYFLNYLDRNAITSARLNNLENDLGLVGSQYNTCISILFVGYLLMQIPSNMIMSSKKIPPSKYMAACMAAWAVVSACTALAKDYKGLVTVRFLLGVTEAPFYPGALYLLSVFYTRKEIATRVAILYAGNILASSFAGLIAAATFETLDGAHGVQGWKWLFIIEGSVTFGVAIIAAFLLPDQPETTTWLSQAERELAVQRIEIDTAELTDDTKPMEGLIAAIKDPRMYLFVFMQNMHLSACSFNNFFPTVVGTLGFNRTITLLLTCPPYLVSAFVGWGVGVSSGKFNERTWHITLSMGAALVGFIIACTTLNTAARYIACFMFASGAYAVNGVILGWVTATCGQTKQKKGSALSLVNVVANASYIYTAYLYPKSDGPRYLPAMSANAAFAFATIAAAWAMKFWLKAENRKIQKSGLSSDAIALFAY